MRNSILRRVSNLCTGTYIERGRIRRCGRVKIAALCFSVKGKYRYNFRISSNRSALQDDRVLI